GAEEKAAALQARDAGALATGQWGEGSGRLFIGLAAVAAEELGHVAVEAGVLTTEAEDGAVLQRDEGGVAATGAAEGVVPVAGSVGAGPEQGAGAAGVAGDVDRAGLIAERGGDRLRAAGLGDWAFHARVTDLGPRRAVVGA